MAVAATYPAVFETGAAAGITYLRRRGPGRVLICLHGIGSRGESFAPMLPHLPGDWDVIAWNAPGYAGSDPLAADWPDEGAYADALLALLDALNLERVTLLGHSLGTLMAARFAADHPGRVEALILGAAACGHGGPVGGPLSEAAAGRLDALQRDGAAAFAAARAPRLVGDQLAHPEALPRVEAAMAAVTMPGYGQAVRMLASGRLADSLRRVSVPAGVIWGAGDVVTPRAQTDRALEALGGAPLRVIPGAGHALHAEAPEAFAAALTDILSALDTEKTEGKTRA